MFIPLQERPEKISTSVIGQNNLLDIGKNPLLCIPVVMDYIRHDFVLSKGSQAQKVGTTAQTKHDVYRTTS